MTLQDIWQAFGTPQVAEITTLIGFATSFLLAQKSTPTYLNPKKR